MIIPKLLLPFVSIFAKTPLGVSLFSYNILLLVTTPQFNNSDNVSVEPVHYSPQYGVVMKTTSLKGNNKIKPNNISTFQTLISDYR